MCIRDRSTAATPADHIGVSDPIDRRAIADRPHCRTHPPATHTKHKARATVLGFKRISAALPCERLSPICFTGSAALAFWTPSNSTQALIHQRFGIAVITCRAYLLAPDPRIECGIGPRNICLFGHHTPPPNRERPKNKLPRNLPTLAARSRAGLWSQRSKRDGFMKCSTVNSGAIERPVFA